MYFIYPSRQLGHLDQALTLFADLTWVKLKQVGQCSPNQICIADVHDFLLHDWSCPTVVLALTHEGRALSEAWQKGALAGWIWEDLPSNPFEQLQAIEARYKRDQDSRDLPAAANLQRCLLPHATRFGEYQFRHLFQPYAYLSGDWFDYWMLNEHEVLFYLADVSGHGVASSLLTSWLAAFHGRAHTPLQLLQKLNRMLIQENIEKHITIITGRLDLRCHQVSCYNAGHFPPAILLSPDQPPQILRSNSLPLGLADDLMIEEVTLDLAVGSRLILCSDGALEPFSGGINDQFEQLLAQFMQGTVSLPTQLNDDIACLSITRLGDSGDSLPSSSHDLVNSHPDNVIVLQP